MRKVPFFVSFVSAVLIPTAARAHIQLTSPQPRFVQDNNGLKTAPCGSGSRTGAVTKLSPGQTLTVTWKESVSHAGHYRIALAASDSEFVEPKDLAIPSTLPSWDLADGIQDKTGTQTYSQSVQIPQADCPTCVLQLIQVMSAGTDGTNTGSFSGVYHACADVSISASAGDAGAGPEVAAPDVRRLDLSQPTVDLRASSDGSSSSDGFTATAGGAGGNGTGGNTVTTMANGGGSGASGATGGHSGAGGSGGADGSGGEAGSASSSASSGGGSGSAAPLAGGSGGDVVAAGGRRNTASGGQGGSAAGGSGDNASSPSASGCSCHMGSPGDSGRFLWLLLAALVTVLRRRGPRSS